MAKNSKRRTTITFHTKNGVFIAYPPDEKGKMSIKAERTAKGQLTSIGYFDTLRKEWFVIKNMEIPYGVKCVIEEQFA